MTVNGLAGALARFLPVIRVKHLAPPCLLICEKVTIHSRGMLCEEDKDDEDGALREKISQIGASAALNFSGALLMIGA